MPSLAKIMDVKDIPPTKFGEDLKVRIFQYFFKLSVRHHHWNFTRYWAGKKFVIRSLIDCIYLETLSLTFDDDIYSRFKIAELLKHKMSEIRNCDFEVVSFQNE